MLGVSNTDLQNVYFAIILQNKKGYALKEIPPIVDHTFGYILEFLNISIHYTFVLYIDELTVRFAV